MKIDEFKQKLIRGCEQLGSPLEFTKLDEITVDECVFQLIKNFDSY